MRTIRLFTDQPLVVDQATALADGPARHLIKVLRQRSGAPVVLFNGDGAEYHGTISAVERDDRCSIAIHAMASAHTESPLQITMIQAIGRGERMDWAIQKAVELGVNAIWPIMSERTEVRLQSERAEKRRQHWLQVAISACEQSGRVRVPEIAGARKLFDLPAPPGCCLYLHPQAKQGPGDLRPAGNGQFSLAVGPEGGFSDPEILWLESRGFTGLRLGPRVLRTETAGPAVIAMLQTRFGDWQ